MALDDTLDLDDQNTESTEDIEEPETEEEEESSEESTEEQEADTSDDEEIDISKYDLDQLDDNQLTEFLETGKLPEGFKPRPQPTDKPSTEPSPEDNSKKGTQSKGTETKPEKTAQAQPTKQEKPDLVDHKAVYDRIFQGFKANGKEIKPRNIEDVISLMQMGANYTKKMQALVPMRKIIESLNHAKIEEADLNFLIDIHKGDKEAIKKLLQTHKVEPMDLDLETTNYVANNNIVSNADAEYSAVIEEVKEHLPKINAILKDQWDEASKQKVLSDSGWLRGLAEEIAMGRFDEIQTILEAEKTFGKFKGVSDIEAYRAIALQMEKEQAGKPSIPTGTKPNTPKRVIPDKKAAAPTKVKAGATGATNLTKKDIFSMSEDEFNKLSVNDLV